MKKALVLASTLLLALAITACTGEQLPVSGGNASGDATATAPANWGSPDSWELPIWPGAASFVDGIDNPYWPLAPGTRWNYEATTDEGTETIELVVLSETRQVAGVTCTVVHDTVKFKGELIEDTYDWYAQDAEGNVWYMGEDSKEYTNGELIGTTGSREAGVDGAKPGIKVWNISHLEEPPYYQEFYRGEAEDLGRDVGLGGLAETPAGFFDGLLVVEEWTPLEPEFIERKYYKSGVGVVKEELIRGGSQIVLLTMFEKP